MTQPNTNQTQKSAAQNTSAPANQNASAAATSQSEPTIWKWKNTAHITKNTMEVGFAVAAVAIAGTAIYAAAAGMALPLAFIAQPWVIAAIASYVAVYFIARSISSWQQTYAMEGAKGENGKDDNHGKDADFSALVKDAVIKSGTISVQDVGEGDSKTQQLFLTLPISDYKALAGEEANKKQVHVLLAGKKVEFQHKDPENNATEYKVQLTSVNSKADLAEMKTALGMTDTSLKVAVSDKDLKTVKQDVATELGEVAVNAAISKAQGSSK